MNIEDLSSIASVIKPIAKQIELLSSRISTNRSAWSGNETATRIQLIDPLLREIGWDTADPDQVTPEYSVGSRNADYVLLSNAGPIAVVEAKNLGVKIDSGSRLQAHSYVDQESIRFVIVTNGDRWELYSSALSATKPLGEFTISRDAPFEAAIEAAKISRDVLVATIGRVQLPMSNDTDSLIDRENIDVVGNKGGGENDPIVGPGRADDRWVPLTKVSALRRGSPLPRQLKFPDTQIRRLGTGVDVLKSVADWLVETGKLDQGNARVNWLKGRSRYLSNNQPFHPTGHEYWRIYEPRTAGIYIEIDLDIQMAVDSASALLIHCRIEPDSVSVRFD